MAFFVFIGATEAHIWWAPIGVALGACGVLFLPWRRSVRYGLHVMGLGLTCAAALVSGTEELIIVLLVAGPLLTIVWEVLVFLATPLLKKSDAQ